MDETQVLKRLKKGDISAMDELVLRYQTKAIRTAYLITRDEPSAEDVVQETFLRIYQRIRFFDETRPFEPYFLRSVVHTALNVAEKSKRELPLQEETAPGGIEDLFARASSVEDQVEYNQLKDQIFAALGKLTPRERSVIVERYYLKMTEKEMAEVHEIAQGTVKWSLNMARSHLRTLLGKEGNRS
jgi:RNA polymerase sigma-70 factor (ECF subfamily)